ncbi:nuclear receptor-interacting protein 1-like [Paramormyrops kingsleyae]|uniref:Nuclear receptor interacting protein 1 n=1 Tax=Paramormyrops kingsleyae TaxID=1676925 RepID=A0A3B3RTK4_9TELE|nr:nuclear receptor-interacting protein 1-like [Paramormyrops kingsleyae]XP_023700803.1 nuclear receptor-interacting protein 1-like [Paramormyrops kingsleyae]
MTHGGEPGSETHQDSAVLTYLEGLLMHQVAGRPSGAVAAQRPEGRPGGQDQADGAARAPPPPHSPAQQDKRPSPGGPPRHFKKARLLRSEAWREPEGQALRVPTGGTNEQGMAPRGGAADSSAQGESTLLASLLQSFGSRLHGAAVTQQVTRDLKESEPKQDLKEPELKEPESKQPDAKHQEPQANKEDPRCCGTASGRLKSLMRRSRTQNHGDVPYRRRTAHESPPQDTPRLPSSDSCATRLKAVAGLAKVRSSPASSPRPSVACSQLALLLSSEAHLQQYSREQAMKAQLSSRAASERLAAMATQKDKHGQPRLTPDAVSSLNAQHRTHPHLPLDSHKQNPSPVPGQSRLHGSPQNSLTARDKRPLSKHSARPSQTCSSLLLLLLNNHNSSNGHPEREDSTLPVQRSPLPSDGEFSNQENGHAKENSDAESSYSCCSPIDLSVKSRSTGPVLGSSSSSSLDKLTESLIKKWKPETPGSETEELKMRREVKSPQKVTLLQLLQDHKNAERPSRITEHPSEFQRDVIPKLSNVPKGRFTPTTLSERSVTQSPANGMPDKNFQSSSTFPSGQDSSGAVSPYRLYASPHIQSTPLDLCKSKSHPSESVQEPAFSASKLLQNLAQCGVQNAAPSPPHGAPMPPSKRLCRGLEIKADKTLPERLPAPVQQNQSPMLDGPQENHRPHMRGLSSPVSEIENLLERRTVLQLLLGNSTSKDKPGSKVSREFLTDSYEKQSEKVTTCDRFNGPSPDVKIKVEPEDEGQLSDDARGVERSCNENARRCLDSVPPQDVKSEPAPTETVPKDGLLSQLLKQQPRNHQANAQADVSVGNANEERQEHQGLVIPKKRRICLELESRLSNDPTQMSAGKATQKGTAATGDRPASRMPEWSSVRQTKNPQLADLPASCLGSESPPKGGRTFNVLKQLLLSDNCLRDLAQPGGTSSPPALLTHCKTNGSMSLGLSHDSSSSKWNLGVPGLGPSELKGTILDSPWGYPGARQEKTNPVPFNKESEGPIQGVISRKDKQDSDFDSPRLTKSNPILYYMLQKGNAHLAREVRDLGAEEHHEVQVKDESEVDVKDYDHKLNLKCHLKPHDEQRGEEGGQLNGSLEKC